MIEVLASAFLGIGIITLIILVFWGVFWTGWALWIAARKGSKAWFLILLIFNTLGILEIIYIFYLSRKETLVNLDAKLDSLVAWLVSSVKVKPEKEHDNKEQNKTEEDITENKDEVEKTSDESEKEQENKPEPQDNNQSSEKPEDSESNN